MDLFSNNRELREYIAQEIRLAMQQERTINSGLDRAAIAGVRAGRILSKMDHIPQQALATVSADLIRKEVSEMFLTAPPVDR